MHVNPCQIQESLLHWFQKHKRVMPWRETDDPYKIWISEIMLQQTQVKTVEGYYNRFIYLYPNVYKLADADIHNVMKAWEGLGYYSRARNIHVAAREIVQKFNGQIPSTLPDLLSLPGVGRYTAGAILSIAFGKKAPILDGNVIRVLTRVFHLTDNVSQASTQKILWDIAEEVLPDQHLREFNEGLMELGATLCKPKSPSCISCPFKGFCKAKELNIQEDLPVKTPKKQVPHYHVVAGIIYYKHKILITLRPPKGLLGGLWEFPGGKVKDNESYENALVREIKEELSLSVDIQKPLVTVKHAYTHFKIDLHTYLCKSHDPNLKLNKESATDFRWISPLQIDAYAFPGANRKVIAKIKEIGDIF